MKKIRILYVEDEPFLAKIVKESLESRNYEVHMVGDGSKVMHAFHAFQPDICVLDVMLPNKDGFSIGKEIREMDREIPIIFLTAKNQTQDVIKGFEFGGNDYIRKPFSMEELIVRIQNLLVITKGTNEREELNEVHIGSYLFSPARMELRRNDMIQKLSYRENELLKFLVSGSKEIIERKEILKKIWGDDSFFNSRTLDVYIKKLRDYFNGDEAIQIITLKGVGYRFVF
jgi:DNA-binding response OmpR family regulator